MPFDNLPRLKPAHLQLIREIADTGKLQDGAARRGMSQPAASRILSDIETTIGGDLFERHPKGMVPTDLGQVFLRHARSILRGLEDLARDVQSLGQGLAGSVRIGAVSGPAVGSVVPAVRRIREEAPDIEVTIEVLPSVPLVRRLQQREFDFVIGRIPPGYDSRDFDVAPARIEHVRFLSHKDHPMARKRQIALGALTEFDWVIQEAGSPIRQALDGAFHRQGLQTPRRITNSSSLLVTLALLDHPGTISPQAGEVAELLTGISPALVTLDLADPISMTPYMVLRNRGHHPSAAAGRVLDEVMRQLQG